MSDRSPAASLLSEASCPLCLELFQDPVSIHCGHNFCRACIERRWENSRDRFPCPRCRDAAPERGLRPNRELAGIIRVAQRLSLRAGVAAGAGRLCPRHGQALKLFCEEEQSPMCRACRQSPEHRLHAAVPIEEAAQEHKEKFEAHARILRERREKMLGLKAAEEEKSLELLERVEAERQRVRAGLRELQQLLEGQERLLLARLAELDREIVRGQERRISALAERIAAAGRQIQELEEKCGQEPWELLQGSRDILSRLEEQSPPEPGETPPEEPKISGLPQESVTLQEMLTKFQVTLTLDPDTAHPRLALSEDGKHVRCEDTRRAVPDHPKRFDSSRCVLGREGFGSGRHYWEVRVGPGTAWAVGVAKESVPRKGRLSVRPERGIWAVGRCGAQCQALTSPAVPIALPQAPEVLGVYVDYEGGRVAFWDPRRAAPMFAYPAGSFGGERLLPLLCLGRGCCLTLLP